MDKLSNFQFANQQNLARFRKLVSEATTVAELLIARSLLKQQEAIAHDLAWAAGKDN